MRPQHFLDFLDEDLLAAGVDNQRVAAVQTQCPIHRERGAVARDHHPLTVDDREGLTGGIGIIEVAQRNTALAGGPTHLVIPGGEEVGVVLRQHEAALAQGEGVGAGVAATVPESHVPGLGRSVAVDQSELRQQL